MFSVVLVGSGGFLGSVCRYVLSGWVQSTMASSFPFGTLAVDWIGSFVLGLVLALSLDRGWMGVEWRLFLTVGFCGGFTTMSAFGYETFYLLREGNLVWATANAVTNLVGAVVGVGLGDLLGRTI